MSLVVLDTVPTGQTKDLTHDLWDPEWLTILAACTKAVPRFDDKDLARALCWAHKHSCYYHTELCDLLETCVAEAAHRLRGEKK